MSGASKQAAMYIGSLLVCSTFALIAPFYPNIIEKKGLPLWIIGLVFSMHPVANLVSSIFIGTYLQKLGRKNVMVASFALTALSMIILSPIEYCDQLFVVIFSILSRILGGVGKAFMCTSIMTVIISDYPEKMNIMIGRMEVACGVGLIFGPVIGTALYSFNLLLALLSVGGVMIIFCPIAWTMLGNFKEYVVKESNINKTKLALKPVIFIKKIMLTLLIDVACLFTFGLITSLLNIHLKDYKVSDLVVSWCFMIEGLVYFLLSLSGGYMFKNIDERYLMTLGAVLLGFGYLILGSCKYYFPNRIGFIIPALPILGMGESLTYSNL